MALNLSTDKNTPKTKSQELLDAYLKGACVFSKGMEKKEAKDYAKTFLVSDHPQFNADYGKPSTDKLLSEVKYEDVLKKEKELKAQAKEAPLKIKANYALDVEPKKVKLSSILGPSLAVLPGLSVLVNAAEQQSEAGVAVGLAGVGVAVGAVAAVHGIRNGLKAKSPEEQKEIDNYIDIKHSQLALKQLKKAIQEKNGTSYKQQVQQLFAAGYGNPGGMITTPAMLKQKAGGR